MKDSSKTNQELIAEISVLKNRIQELEQSEAERKRVEEALRESETRYRSLVESMPGIVYSFSHKRGGVYYSLHVTNLLCYLP